MEVTAVSPPNLKGMMLVLWVQWAPWLHQTEGWRVTGSTGATELHWNSLGPPQTSSMQRRERSSLLQGGGAWEELQEEDFFATAASVHVKECQLVLIISMLFTAGRDPTHDEEALWRLKVPCGVSV